MLKDYEKTAFSDITTYLKQYHNEMIKSDCIITMSNQSIIIKCDCSKMMKKHQRKFVFLHKNRDQKGRR